RRASTDGVADAFVGPDGVALARTFDEILEKVEPFAVTIEDYPELFGVAIADQVVRRQGAPGHRIRIYGPLEARLTNLDLVLIGGLGECVGPPDPLPDPWLSRPMRHALGLDLPERRVGLAAHDFAQLCGAREVFLTYPAKRGGAPTVASRFVQRLAAVVGTAVLGKARGGGGSHRGGFGRPRVRAGAPPPRGPPSAPRPARPRRAPPGRPRCP